MEDNKLVLVVIVFAIIAGLGYWKKSSNDEKRLEKERIALEVEKAKLEKEKAELLAKNSNSQQQVKESPEQQIARLKQAQQSNNYATIEQQPKVSVKEKSDTDIPESMLISYAKERFHSGVVLRSLDSFYQGNMSILCGEAMLNEGWRSFVLVHTSNRQTGTSSIQLNVNHDIVSTAFQDNVRSVYCHN